MIDFRSDTVTRPTPAMLNYMYQAPVGDDVFGEDPSINALEAKTAGIFGMEAGLFCPSGTMTNQLAIKTHTQAGDEVICEELSHIYQYEGGGIAFNSGCSVKLIQGNRGRLTAEQVLAGINPEDVHKPISTLVSVENTCNRGGGACYNFQVLEAIHQITKQHHLGFHLDGARIFNAIVFKKEDPKKYGTIFDTISICLSKGLGAPVGSVLLGSSAFIKKARRWRKVFGGGMRQAGQLAAAGIYALDHHVLRLAEDHQLMQHLAQGLSGIPGLQVEAPQTNILFVDLVGEAKARGVELQAHLKQAGIDMTGLYRMRFVTHLDVDRAGIDRTISAVRQFFNA